MTDAEFEKWSREQTKQEMLMHLFDILKDEDGNFRIEHSCYLDENGKVVFHNDFNEWDDKKDCSQCRFCDIHGDVMECRKAWELFGYNMVCYIVRCDAEDIVEYLTLIKTQEEMLEYFDRLQGYFGCIEDWEWYCGVDASQFYDEETGNMLEEPSAKKVFERGGTIKKLPKEYPVVVWYDINCKRPMEMLYVGTETICGKKNEEK